MARRTPIRKSTRGANASKTAESSVQSPVKSTSPSSVAAASPSGISIIPYPSIGPGWTLKIVPRLSSSAKAADKYYIDPEGKKFRSIREVERHLGKTVAEKDTKGTDATVRRGSRRKSNEPRESSDTTKSRKSVALPKFAVGNTVVSKVFTDPDGNESSFTGFVVGYDGKEKLYKIRYVDNDEEELSEDELEEIIVPLIKNTKADAHASKSNGKYDQGTVVKIYTNGPNGENSNELVGIVGEYNSDTGTYKIDFSDGSCEDWTERALAQSKTESKGNKRKKNVKSEGESQYERA